MLLASDERQAADLLQRRDALRAAGQEARLLDAREATRAEPALRLPADGAALLVPRDAQLVWVLRLLSSLWPSCTHGRGHIRARFVPPPGTLLDLYLGAGSGLHEG